MDNLPIEIFFAIFGLLDLEDLLTASSVSCRWREAAKLVKHSLKKLQLEPLQLEKKTDLEFLPQFPNLRILDLSWHRKFSLNQFPIIAKLTRLESLSFKRCSFTLDGYMQSFSSLKNLKNLNLWGNTISWSHMVQFLSETIDSSQLVSLSLPTWTDWSGSRSETFKLFQRFSNLRSLSIGGSRNTILHAEILEMVCRYEFLENLTLDEFQMEYRHLVRFGSLSTCLKSLSLHCKAIDSDIYFSCLGNLRALNLDYCTNLNKVGFGIPYMTLLKTLSLRYCYRLDAEAFPILGGMRHLKVLDLNNSGVSHYVAKLMMLLPNTNFP